MSFSQEDIAELQELLKVAKRERVRQLLLSTIGSSNKNSNQMEVEPKVVPTTPAPTVGVPLKTTTVDPSEKNYSILSNYYWDQTDQFVKVYVDLEGAASASASNVHPKFEESSFDLRIDDLNGKHYRFSLSKLNNKIVPKESSYKLGPKRIIFSLKKSGTQHWSGIQVKEDNKALKTPKLDSKADPEKGIMDLMRNMYDSGDDDMKRTIAKAWTEAREKKDDNKMPKFDDMP